MATCMFCGAAAAPSAIANVDQFFEVLRKLDESHSHFFTQF